jgi:hypothetical protein
LEDGQRRPPDVPEEADAADEDLGAIERTLPGVRTADVGDDDRLQRPRLMAGITWTHPDFLLFLAAGRDRGSIDRRSGVAGALRG